MTTLETRLAQDLLRLCAIKSEYGDERALADHVQERLERLRAGPVKRVNHSVIAGEPSGARPLVTLLGHLDTVPDAGNAWPPRREGDLVLGLGASDMKAGLAVMLALAEEQVAHAGGRYDLALVFYDKEEGPDAANGLEPVLDACPWLQQTALAFCLEPTDGELHLGCLGGLHAKVTFKGRPAHSARPWQGENAIAKAGPFLAELLALKPRDVDLGPDLVYREVTTVTLAKGGTGRNVVPGDFELNVNVRFAPGRSLEDAERELRERVAGRAEVEITDRSLAGKVPAGNAHLERFEKVSRAKRAPKQAWTDVARLGARGIDAVNFGPGWTAQAHQKNERASIAATVAAYETFARFFAAD